MSCAIQLVLTSTEYGQPYLDSDMQSRWFDFGDDTVIRTDQFIRLTPQLSSRHGWVFSRVPLTATNWEVRHTRNYDHRSLNNADRSFLQC